MKQKKSQLRVKDNYTGFYLKIIEPLKKKITKGGKEIQNLYQLKNYLAILGYQFENILLANKTLIHKALNITSDQLISSAPFLQTKTEKTPQACQIDLLIHTDLDIFLCVSSNVKKQ